MLTALSSWRSLRSSRKRTTGFGNRAVCPWLGEAVEELHSTIALSPSGTCSNPLCSTHSPLALQWWLAAWACSQEHKPAAKLITKAISSNKQHTSSKIKQWLAQESDYPLKRWAQTQQQECLISKQLQSRAETNTQLIKTEATQASTRDTQEMETLMLPSMDKESIQFSSQEQWVGSLLTTTKPSQPNEFESSQD